MERLPVATCLTVLLSFLASGPSLLRWGAERGLPSDSPSAFSLRPEAVLEGQVYRLVTYICVYEDVISLVCGAIIIWYFAGSFEKTVGTVRHCFLTVAFAISLAVLYLMLWAALSRLWEVADAKGFVPVAFAMLAASIARSRMRRTLLFGVNIPVALVPWVLICVAWFILSSSPLGNICGLLIGNIYGYGYCFGADLPESMVSRLDQKFPFRLLKRIPGMKYVPGSIAERRASQSRKLNPAPGSYPTQSYHSSPPPSLLAVHMQHPSTRPPGAQPQCLPGLVLNQSTNVLGGPCVQHHFQSPPGSISQHFSGSNPAPGSYPTQSYHSSPPPSLLAVHMQHPSTRPPGAQPQCLPSLVLNQSTNVLGGPCVQHHFQSPPGSISQHFSGSNLGGPKRTEGSGVPHTPGFPAAGAASESAELCRVHVG